MATIKISPEQVKSVASQFRQSSQESQNMVSKLQSSMTNMQGEWQGMTQQRFFQEYEQWRTSMTNFVSLLNQIATQLDEVATKFAQVDGQG